MRIKIQTSKAAQHPGTTTRKQIDANFIAAALANFNNPQRTKQIPRRTHVNFFALRSIAIWRETRHQGGMCAEAHRRK